MPKESNVTIESIVYEMPPHEITSVSIEEQISKTLNKFGIPIGNLENLTGIKTRRFWEKDEKIFDIATKVARNAIKNAGIELQEVGCIINTSVSKNILEPSYASVIHGNLRLSPHCINYDIGNACLGFLDGMSNIAMMIEAKLIDYGVIVNVESSREIVEETIKSLQDQNISLKEFKENFATLTLGSGAVAMVLSHKDLSKSGHTINSSIRLAATKYNQLSVGRRKEMITDAPALLMAGVDLAKDAWEVARHKIKNWDDAKIDIYIPHQVSIRHIQSINQALNLTDKKVFVNVQYLGNIGPASIPIALKMAEESKTLKKGHHVALLGIGSGLNCTGMSLSW